MNLKAFILTMIFTIGSSFAGSISNTYKGETSTGSFEKWEVRRGPFKTPHLLINFWTGTEHKFCGIPLSLLKDMSIDAVYLGKELADPKSTLKLECTSEDESAQNTVAHATAIKIESK